MKTTKSRIFTLFLAAFTAFSAAAARAQQCADPVPPPTVGELTATLDGITEAMFSPSGKWTILQTGTGFYVLPTDRLDQAENDLENSRLPFTEGYAKGFLPQSEKVIFAPRRGLYALDPLTLKSEPIFQTNATDPESGYFLGYSEVIIASEDLIISGDGDYTRGLGSGNILRFDVKRRTVTRGAPINGLRKAYLSPSHQYVLFEHPAEEAINIHLYDIARGVATPISERFDFKTRSAKYVVTSVFPLGWVAETHFAAVVNEAPSEEYEEESKNPKRALSWLVSFEVESGKILWRRQLKRADRAVKFEMLSKTEAFFDAGEANGPHKVSLTDGKFTRLPRLAGTGFSFSPDKKQVAFFGGRRMFVAFPNGANKTLAYEFSENPEVSALVSTDNNRIIWSPDGGRLLVSSASRTFVLQLK